jgi:hypothetical protein
METINPKDLTPVVRQPRLSLEENVVVEATIWKIYEAEKTYNGESQGTCPTFELTTSGKEVLILQSKSNSSYAMLNDWDDKKVPCHVYVWKETTGSKPEIMWCYRDA